MSDPIKLATRATFDGVRVTLWSDGLITRAMGHGIRGIGTARNAWKRKADLRAGWAVLGELALFDASELPTVIRNARALSAKLGSCDNPTAAQWRQAMLKNLPSD